MDFAAACEAASEGRLEQLRDMLERARSASSDRSLPGLMPRAGRSPLVLAAQRGRVGVVRYLLDAYASSRAFVDQTATAEFDSSSLHRCTALAVAAIGGHAEVVSLLLAHGASTELADCLSCTPLCEAVFHNRAEVARRLLASGADAHAANTFGFGPLHVAVTRGSVALTTLLLEHGARPGQTAPGGYTALHLAAYSGYPSVVKCLLEWGASPLFPDPPDPARSRSPLLLPAEDDYTPCPLFLAAAKRHRSVVALLRGLPSCPPSCAADASKLLGVAAAELPGSERHWESWRDACRLHREDDSGRGDEAALPCYYRHSSSRGDAELLPRAQSLLEKMRARGLSEFATPEACEALRRSKSRLGVLRQCLLVAERCMGGWSRLMPGLLTAAAEAACAEGRLEEAAELVWAGVCTSEAEWLGDLKSGTILPRTVAGNLLCLVRKPVAAVLVFLINSNFAVRIADYVASATRITEAVLARDREIRAEYGCPLESGPAALEAVLLLLNVWLFHVDQAPGAGPGLEGGTESCESVGRQLVADYLLPGPGGETPLLEVALRPVDRFSEVESASAAVEGGLRRYVRWSRASVLLEALLQWGGGRGLNAPSRPHGNRPLHLAAEQRPTDAEVISLLLAHGAHPDAVNDEGKTAADLLPETSPTRALLAPASPLPLACQASRCVLATGLDYASSDRVPPRLKELIRLHEPLMTSPK